MGNFFVYRPLLLKIFQKFINSGRGQLSGLHIGDNAEHCSPLLRSAANRLLGHFHALGYRRRTG